MVGALLWQRIWWDEHSKYARNSSVVYQSVLAVQLCRRGSEIRCNQALAARQEIPPNGSTAVSVVHGTVSVIHADASVVYKSVSPRYVFVSLPGGNITAVRASASALYG